MDMDGMNNYCTLIYQKTVEEMNRSEWTETTTSKMDMNDHELISTKKPITTTTSKNEWIDRHAKGTKSTKNNNNQCEQNVNRQQK